jgi:hypothetical protein
VEGLIVDWVVSQWAKVQHPIVVSNAVGKIGGAEWKFAVIIIVFSQKGPFSTPHD